MSTTFLPVAEAYDRWAAGYDAYDNPMVFSVGRVLADRAGTAAGLDIVELGCGTGRNLALLAEAGAASLTGCDLSPGMLARARMRDPRFRLICCDITRPLPLADGCADLVLLALTLEHVARLETPLAEARRLLRPGGRVVIVEIHPDLAAGGVAAHFVDKGGEVRMPVHAHRRSDYLAAAAAAGLTVAICRDRLAGELGPDTPAKVLKRGANSPLVLELELELELMSPARRSWRS